MSVHRLSAIILPIFLFLLQACSPIYVPSSHHTPLLDKKGELNGNLQVGTHGTDIKGAYAVSDRIGIAAAASFADLEAEQGGTVNPDFHQHSYGEGAISYFRPFGGIGRFEILGGLGAGSASSVDTFNFSGSEEKTTGKFNKLFAQTNIGLETNIIETGLSLRLGHVTFTEFETESDIYDGTEAGTFFEPAVFARLGWKNVKIEAQYGVNAQLQDEIYYPYQPFHFSFGVNVNLETR